MVLEATGLLDWASSMKTGWLATGSDGSGAPASFPPFFFYRFFLVPIRIGFSFLSGHFVLEQEQTYSVSQAVAHLIDPCHKPMTNVIVSRRFDL